MNRHRLTPLLAIVSLTFSQTLFADPGFDFQELQYRARALAARPFEKPEVRVPKSLLDLTYDQHRDIRFIPERSFWREDNLPFELQFFHPGWIFPETIQVNEVEGRRESPIPFSSRLFDYGKNEHPKSLPRNMGFSGFRVHYALNNPQYLDELIVFQGASYFRALGKNQHYGLSARGLAIDTGEPTGEEFPIFREFWLTRPTAQAKSIVIYALLDSHSVSGAYRFTVTPGEETIVNVRATLYLRNAVKTLGIAPLTSMFWHGENSPTQNQDFRPEVHDSDGLLMFFGSGEWLWRPLENPNTIRTVAFNDLNPRGFGLLQRDRNFENYQDLEANYHLRPSAWVEPIGNWGRGSVRLVELPTPDETNDNIVAFWCPDALPAIGEPFDFEYNLRWQLQTEQRPPSGATHATRPSGVMKRPDLHRFVVDFDSSQLRSLSSGVEGIVSVGGGAKLHGTVTQKNNYNGTWRVAFEIEPDGSGKPAELRAFLRKGENVLSETWSYLWQP